MTIKTSLRQGISKSIKDVSSANRPAVNSEKPSVGFYIGVVMDDTDEQLQGKLYVYIPRYSERRFGPDASPFGGTPRDRETGELRLKENLNSRTGWIPCRPLLPFFGGDHYRVNEIGKRSAYVEGDINSYGFWYTPRIGDQVGVLFDQSDPNTGYWIGCVPKEYTNFSTPGTPGVSKNTLSQKSLTELGGSASFRDDALVPSFERVNIRSKQTTGRRFDDVQVMTNYAGNLLEAGLIADPLRGASVSSPRRESPSYVMGFKSPGWDFGSEKNHINASTGLKFDGSRPGATSSNTNSTYRNVSSVGHQFIMDDHPDYQGLRLRTSAGSQLYFNDSSANDPFIYINTPRGNVWIEMRDDGRLDIFSSTDMSFHAGGNLNFYCDGDMLTEVKGNMRTRVHGNQEMKITGTTAWEMDAQTSIKITPSLDIDITGTYSLLASDSWRSATVQSEMNIKQTGDINIKSSASARMEALANVDLLGSGLANLTGGGSVNVRGGILAIDGGVTYINSGVAATATPAQEAADPTTLPVTPPEPQPGPPTPEQIRLGGTPAPVQTIVSRLPQHQPWVNSAGNSSPRGFRGFIDETTPVDDTQKGAAREDATAPLSQRGFFNGSSVATAVNGVPYSSSSIAELPQYDQVRELDPGELTPASGLTLSDRGIDFIKQQEGLETRAYVDVDKWAIGYGHNLRIGDTITGTLNGQPIVNKRVDAEFLATMNRTGGNLIITEEEAERLFREDIEREYAAAVRKNITSDITQGQFDAMVSLSYNIGPAAFAKSTVVKSVNSKNYQNVPENFLRFRKIRRNGVLVDNAGLLRRRREEIEQLWGATPAEVAGVA